ncbi:MAG: DUF1553 domain-containing protein [Bryobacteraceae bacterium]|nr:DUF1553 domain-containing protein [Bryobacteraceae bacterium]
MTLPSALLCLLSAQLPAAVDFATQIQPLLAARCAMCHDGDHAQKGLVLTSGAALLRGGVVVPGDPQKSLLFEKISGDKPAMPPVGQRLSLAEVDLIRRWIAEGAKVPPEGETDSKGWWSLRPLRRPPVPAATPWSRTTIDRFIAATHSAKGLAPSPEADRRTLLRRLKFDLHGLPPEPEEMAAFLSDPDPRAYENLVDRLLASPRYGERWGRHWLDVVHYGESHGYDKDKPRRNAWPYRDYVIRAFNADKPYARFIREQIAGDALYPESNEGVVATGALVAGPWDFVGHAELREGTRDKRIARLLDRDDMLMTVMSSFTSLTVHCARCHDHKFDPIRQSDYYALQAVFAGVDRADQPLDADPAVRAQRQGLLRKLREIEFATGPIEERLGQVSSREMETVKAALEEIDQRRTLLNHEKTAGGTPKQKTRNAELDAERQRLAQEAQALNARLRELRLNQIADAERNRLVQLRAEEKEAQAALKALPEPQWVYAAAAYFPSSGKFTPALEPRPVHVLQRGDVDAPKELAEPGAVTAVRALPARFALPAGVSESARRVALADWIAHPDNPLTWRSIVNRVWHYHFGKGLVDSPNDFGRMGARPTHPELLDWLAAEFRDSGGSLKQLHRLMVTSAVYRQSSNRDPAHARIDADNQFLWRMSSRRLDAESVRDSVLQIAGSLDLTMGGPSDEHFWFKDDHSPVYDYARYSAAAARQRRSVYRFLVRSVPDPWMESLDCPDPSLLTPKRNVTMTAVQALALLNDPLVIEQSRRLAGRLRAASPKFPSQLALLYSLTLNRRPSAAEEKLLASYTASHGLENLCRVVINSNEFLFID